MSAELSQSPRTSPLSAADIDDAAQRISGVVLRSPLQFSERLSEATGASVYLKREDLQTVRSYKLRGAYNLLMQLSADEIAAGVVCSSAGNHAQGFAMACRSMGIHGRVYVPGKTPKQKRDRIRYHGREFIELIVVGKTYDEAAAAALEDVARTGATLVPPYDDLRTIAGQGTIAVEILDQLDGEPDLVIVPVGGGGCIAGITDVPGRTHQQHVGARCRAGRGGGDDRRAGRGRAGDARPRRPVRRRRGGAPRGHADVRGAGRGRGHGVDHDRRRGRGVHRDARPVPERGHHRRARGGAVGGGAAGSATSSRDRLWCA